MRDVEMLGDPGPRNSISWPQYTRLPALDRDLVISLTHGSHIGGFRVTSTSLPAPSHPYTTFDGPKRCSLVPDGVARTAVMLDGL